ncbi:MAG: hypothetical protein FWF20_03885 [Betaproteobacteria bacterium]|nr:hypothetical protein [Betaproteobacteria bacterium]MCL2885922.1 hypothetical protein [Betaproteobacteria bacterium]
MFTIDALPDMPDAQPPVVLVAQAKNAAARGGKAKEIVIGSCQPTEYLEPGVDWMSKFGGNWVGGAMFSPNHTAWSYLKYVEKWEITGSSHPSIHDVEIVRQPKHGKVALKLNRAGEERLFYVPDGGYVGTDRVDFRVRVGDQLVRIVQFFKVTKLPIEGEDSDAAWNLCKRREWRISSADNAVTLTNSGWDARLPTLLAAASRSVTGFADLPGLARVGWVERSDKAEGRRTAEGWFRVAGCGKAAQTPHCTQAK